MGPVGVLFQFPSNGKVCSKTIIATTTLLITLGFNSLQTGKCVARLIDYLKDVHDTVSIPFKRESV